MDAKQARQTEGFAMLVRQIEDHGKIIMNYELARAKNVEVGPSDCSLVEHCGKGLKRTPVRRSTADFKFDHYGPSTSPPLHKSEHCLAPYIVWMKAYFEWEQHVQNLSL